MRRMHWLCLFAACVSIVYTYRAYAADLTQVSDGISTETVLGAAAALLMMALTGYTRGVETRQTALELKLATQVARLDEKIDDHHEEAAREQQAIRSEIANLRANMPHEYETRATTVEHRTRMERGQEELARKLDHMNSTLQQLHQRRHGDLVG